MALWVLQHPWRPLASPHSWGGAPTCPSVWTCRLGGRKAGEQCSPDSGSRFSLVCFLLHL